MIWKFYYLLTLLTFTTTRIRFASSKSANSKSELFVGSYPIPPKTPGSININTGETKNADLEPIVFFIKTNAMLKATNTGKSVTLFSDEVDTVATVTGGPLLDEDYIFHSLRHYWAANASEVADTTLDGENIPLAAEIYFFKLKYGSFDNAIRHRDGIAQINHLMRVGGLANPQFLPFADTLRKIRDAGSTAITSVTEAIGWYDYLVLATEYYSYPGSYTDERTGRTYYCTITVVFPPRLGFTISKEQFDYTFLSLKDEKGNLLTNAARPQSSEAPIIHSRGAEQIVTPV